MTTEAARNLYLAQHLYSIEGKSWAIYNPHYKPISKLPVIYGFNNGGKRDWLKAVLLAEDGECLGSHICSHEAYMTSDLGILEGSRPDRHEDFKKHYPEGYRMEFISLDDVPRHEGLNKAIKLNKFKQEENNEH